MKTTLLLCALLCALIVAGFSASLKLKLLDRIALQMFAYRVGETVPDFELQAVDGQSYSLHQATEEHELVVINYWATWCGPCRLELPEFVRDYPDLKASGNLQILAITSETAEEVEPFLEDLPLPFPVLLDPEGSLAELHGVEALPTSVVVGAGGRVVDVRTGLFPGIGSWIRNELNLPEAEQR